MRFHNYGESTVGIDKITLQRERKMLERDTYITKARFEMRLYLSDCEY